MLYAFFSKSKPINFVVLLTLLAVVYANALFFMELPSEFAIWQGFANLVLLVFGLLLVDFISKKNAITKNNTLAPFLFVLLLAAFHPLLVAFEAVLSGVLVLIALRRVISLRTHNNVVQKVFDSTFWILIASLFNEWCLLFIVAVYAALALFKIAELRIYLVPWAAVVIVGILVFTYVYVFDSLTFFEDRFGFNMATDFTLWKAFPWNVLLWFLTIAMAVSLVNYLMKIQKQKGIKRETSLLILVIWAIALAVFILGKKEGFQSSIYLLFPISILYTNLLQRLPKQWMQEATLGVTAILLLSSLVL